MVTDFTEESTASVFYPEDGGCRLQTSVQLHSRSFAATQKLVSQLVCQSPLLGFCRSSIAIVATSVILLLATLLLSLFSNIKNVWEVFYLTSCWRRCVALKAGSVRAPAKNVVLPTRNKLVFRM